jgi:DNA-binding XRE family transcriptional regulator
MDIKNAHQKGLINIDNLAEAIGVSRRTVYNWIAGTTLPNILQAYAIEKSTQGVVKVKDWG